MARRFGSDVMVDAIKACGFSYVSLNPGSSYRGLHDSLVNYGGNEPQIITCNHEKLAVSIAHGYAKAAHEPMAVILHDIVGLLQGTMGIYYALDRPRAGGRLRRRRADGLRPPPAEHRLDPHRERPGQRRPRLHEVGRPARVGRLRARVRDARLPDRERGAAGARLRRARRGPAGGRADRGRAAPELGPAEDAVADRPRPGGAAPLAERLCAAERPLVVTSYAGRDPHAFGAAGRARRAASAPA